MSRTWTTIVTHTEYTFEDPILSGYTEVTTYNQMYGKFLKTLDGSDEFSFFDLYFRPSPINDCHWEFIDHDARADFVDICQEMGLIGDLQKLREGSWDKPKPKPKPKAKPQPQPSKPQSDEPKKKKAPLTEAEKKERILAQQLNTIDILTKQMETTQISEQKRAKNQAKINKLREQIQESMDCDPVFH